MSRYNALPSGVMLYCTMYSKCSLKADLQLIFTLRHLLYLVRSQLVYHCKRLFSHLGKLNVAIILNDLSWSQAFSTSQASLTTLHPLSHSQQHYSNLVILNM